MKNSLKTLLAWALFALIAIPAFAATANKGAILVWSLAPQDVAYRPLVNGNAYSVTYECANTGDAAGFLSEIDVWQYGVVDAVVEVGGQAYTLGPSDQKGYRIAYLTSGLTIEPGEKVQVRFLGLTTAGDGWTQMYLAGASGTYTEVAYPDSYPYGRQIFASGTTFGLGHNFSSRSYVVPGTPAIVGFTVSGDAGVSYPVLIRAVGPTLAQFGVKNYLADPVISVYYYGDKPVYTDQGAGWQGVSPTVFSAVGAFPLPVGSKDAAIVIRCQPGAYTVQVGGSGSGTVLIEAYQLPPSINATPSGGKG